MRFTQPLPLLLTLLLPTTLTTAQSLPGSLTATAKIYAIPLCLAVPPLGGVGFIKEIPLALNSCVNTEVDPQLGQLGVSSFLAKQSVASPGFECVVTLYTLQGCSGFEYTSATLGTSDGACVYTGPVNVQQNQYLVLLGASSAKFTCTAATT